MLSSSYTFFSLTNIINREHNSCDIFRVLSYENIKSRLSMPRSHATRPRLSGTAAILEWGVLPFKSDWFYLSLVLVAE